MTIFILHKSPLTCPTLEKKEATKKFYVGQVCPRWQVLHYNNMSINGTCVQYLFKDFSKNSIQKYKDIDLNNYRLLMMNMEKFISGHTCVPLSKFDWSEQSILDYKTERVFDTLIEADEFCKRHALFRAMKTFGLFILSKSFDDFGAEISSLYDIEKIFPGMTYDIKKEEPKKEVTSIKIPDDVFKALNRCDRLRWTKWFVSQDLFIDFSTNLLEDQKGNLWYINHSTQTLEILKKEVK